jgi:hypothetical protein
MIKILIKPFEKSFQKFIIEIEEKFSRTFHTTHHLQSKTTTTIIIYNKTQLYLNYKIEGTYR